MKKIYVAFSIAMITIIILLILSVPSMIGPRYFNPENVSSKVIELCKEKGSIECHGDCVDGFGEDCYFDSMVYDKDSFKTGHTIPEEVKEICFAIHSTSVCGQCLNRFEIRKDSKLTEVSCEEFFQAIEDKNQTCNGCVDIIQYGCCWFLYKKW